MKTNQSTKINLLGCDTIVNSPSSPSCDYCDKKLTSKSSLILHIRTADNTDIDDKSLFLMVFHQVYLKTLYMLDGRLNLKLSTFLFSTRPLHTLLSHPDHHNYKLLGKLGEVKVQSLKKIEPTNTLSFSVLFPTQL